MDNKKFLTIAVLATVVLLTGVALAVTGYGTQERIEAGGQRPSSDVTANVYLETDDGISVLKGSGTSVRSLVLNALKGAGNTVECPANGILRSVNGDASDDDNPWMTFQWTPPFGWKEIALRGSFNKDLREGTSYYVAKAAKSEGEYGVVYEKPKVQPEGKVFFFIMMKEDYNANENVKAMRTESERRNGFWVSGMGPTVADALLDICDKYGHEIDMSTGIKGDGTIDLTFRGWLNSFLGLGDDKVSGGGWKYWSQYAWDEDMGEWGYNQWCLGNYDSSVYHYFALVRQITYEHDLDLKVPVTPADIPEGV